jgi:hypothetical protein
MAYSSNAEASYGWIAHAKSAFDVKKEISSELLVIRDHIWEDNVSPFMESLSCNDIRDLAFQRHKVLAVKNFDEEEI